MSTFGFVSSFMSSVQCSSARRLKSQVQHDMCLQCVELIAILVLNLTLIVTLSLIPSAFALTLTLFLHLLRRHQKPSKVSQRLRQLRQQTRRRRQWPRSG